MEKVKPFLSSCPSQKVQYEIKVEALLCIVHWELKDDGHPRPIRAYLCPLCGAYHLTSQPSRKPPELIKHAKAKRAKRR